MEMNVVKLQIVKGVLKHFGIAFVYFSKTQFLRSINKFISCCDDGYGRLLENRNVGNAQRGQIANSRWGELGVFGKSQITFFNLFAYGAYVLLFGKFLL